MVHDGKATNLGDLIGPQADMEKAALVYIGPEGETERYSFGQIDALSARFGATLLANGYERGKSIGILARNSAWYVIAYLGIMRAGLVAVPVSFRQPTQMVEHCLRDSDTILVLHDELTEVPDAGVPCVLLGPDMFDALGGAPDDVASFQSHRNEPRDVAMILYTSGSTGRPKGVALSHQSQLFAFSSMEPQRDRIRTETISIAAPLYHMNALSMMKVTLLFDATAVLFHSFDVETLIREIPKNKITWMTGIPTMFALMAARPDLLSETDLSSVRRINMASAPLTDNLLDLTREHFPNALLLNGYGTTEHGPAAFCPHPGGLPMPPLSTGVGAPGVGLRLVGYGRDDYGVLEVNSPANMNGYWKLPEKTAERMVDGWYHTGDLFRRDENGFYFFIGREDDQFVCNGENILPGEVELVLERHPAIRQACVVPVADPIRGDTPVAFVTGDASAATEAEIQDYYRRNAPPVQYPRRVVFVDEMPLAGTNKIDRKLVKAWAEDIEVTGKT